jgi:hypothetical protein
MSFLRAITSSTYSFTAVMAVHMSFNSNLFFALDKNPLTIGYTNRWSSGSIVGFKFNVA